MTSQGENSGSFKQLRHGGEIPAHNQKKHSHSFDFKATFKKNSELNKRSFFVGERFAKCEGARRVG